MKGRPTFSGGERLHVTNDLIETHTNWSKKGEVKDRIKWAK